MTRAIVNLLLNPNADSPLNCDAGNTIRAGDMLAFNSMAYMYTIEYATDESANEAEEILSSYKMSWLVNNNMVEKTKTNQMIITEEIDFNSESQTYSKIT